MSEPPAESMMAAQRNDERAGVALLLSCFSDAVDHRDPERVANLFTEDGLFRPGDREMRGRAAIQTFYTARFSDERRHTRHVWANLVVDAYEADAAGLKALLTNYAFEPNVSETELQMRIGDVTGRCERGGDGHWRFAEHLYVRAFAARLPLNLG